MYETNKQGPPHVQSIDYDVIVACRSVGRSTLKNIFSKDKGLNKVYRIANIRNYITMQKYQMYSNFKG